MTNADVTILTGEGKGKTTAALGLAWRTVSEGKRAYVVQFMKPPESSGEHFSAEAFKPLITIRPAGRRGFIRKGGGKSLDAELAAQAMEEAKAAILGGEYGLVVLDEINVALHIGLVELADVLSVIDSKPAGVGLLLTGRYAHPEISARAGNVIEMRKTKHHFDNGITAREGIEY